MKNKIKNTILYYFSYIFIKYTRIILIETNVFVNTVEIVLIVLVDFVNRTNILI